MSVSGPATGGPQAIANPVTAERSPLPRDLSDFLAEFSLALGHQAAYPERHPVLVAAADRLTQALTEVLAHRTILTLGVAKRQFVIDGTPTDPANPLLGNLAQRFHRHRIAALKLERGIMQTEVGKLLSAIGTDPRRGEGPLGLQPEENRSWAHALVYPAQYSRLELSDDSGAGDSEGNHQDVGLWMELARAALPDGGETESAGSIHPGVVAAAINRRVREAGYDRTVVDSLSRVAEEVAIGETVEQAWLRRRLSRLIASLEPAALERLLQVSGTDPQQRKLVLAASQTLAADAVLKVVQAAGESSTRNVSDSLMLLLGKLAQHAESGAPEVAPAADTALRENVSKLVSDWALDDPNPEAYSSALQEMARNSRAPGAGGAGSPAFGLDDEMILNIGLEIGETGARVHLAAGRMVADGRTRQLTELLERAAKAGAETGPIWGRVASPDLLRSELAKTPVDFTVVEALVSRLSAGASGPLLDSLAASEDRSTRWNLLRILAEVGPPAAPAVAARLQDTPWFVQRNLLLLLGRMGIWPEGFSPTSYVSHEDPRVRREAYRLLLDSTGTREAAIVDGLVDGDAAIVAMVLAATVSGCPPAAIPLLQSIAQDAARDIESRLLAVRALAGSADPDGVRRLAALAQRRRWWGGVRLAPKSPVLIAVLKALADAGAQEADAAAVLALAARHRDAEIRAAAERVGG
jgi:hypothetical protein